MAKADINLFKAAGGERAKSGKRSPVSIMIVAGIVLVIAALGVAAFFNFKVITANNNYQKKEKILANYNRTIADPDVITLSEEYKMIMDDIESTAAINAYVETRSALFPEATESEVMAIRNLIHSNPSGVTFTLTTSAAEDEMDRIAAGIEESEEPVEEEEDETRSLDYEGLRSYLYDDEVEPFTDRELFYYALESLAKKQEEADDNVWYAYYRCYFVMVFTCSDSFDVTQLVSMMSSIGGAMGGQTPFSKVAMVNDEYNDGYYVPAKYKMIEYEDTYYQIMLMPMKSVIERAYDILSAHSTALIEQNHWEGQPEYASFEMRDIVLTNEDLSFSLILPPPQTVSMSAYVDEFDASHFFEVDYTFTRSDGDSVSEELVSYPIKLKFKNRPEIEKVEE